MEHQLDFLQSGPTTPRGVVLMLHGGAEKDDRPAGGRSLALRRTRVMYAAIAGRLHDADLSVGLLRFATRGWNAHAGPTPAPVADARWALAQTAVEHPGLPIVLLGHSMGARTSAQVADDPAVIGVVALAPWFPPDDPIEPLRDRQVTAAHGTRDRITSPRATRKYLARVEPIAASVRFVDLGPVGHYMLRRHRLWNDFAVIESLAMFD